jgi:hypothetical protein
LDYYSRLRKLIMGFKQVIRFTSDAGTTPADLHVTLEPLTDIPPAALEKILRFLQSLSQILAVYAATVEDAKTWWLLRTQFALGVCFHRSTTEAHEADILNAGRRYFRFFKFLDSFSKAFDSFYATDGVVGVLEVGKWSCLGAYLFLESLTIVSALCS